MNEIKELFFNLLILLLSMLFLQTLVMNRIGQIFLHITKWKIAVIAIIQVFICMMFTYTFEGEFKFDFRMIPILIAGLYGGPWVSAVVMIATILFRIPLGGDGIYTTLIVIPLAALISSLLSNYFLHSSTSRKVCIVGAITFIFSLLVFIMPVYFFNYPINWYFIMVFTTSQTIGMIIVTYTTELMIQNIHLQRAIIKSEKMEVVSHLAASISHEVRNPLTVTKGFIQLLKDDPTNNSKKNYYLNTALEELNRAEGIINDYLTFAKPHPEQLERMPIHEEILKVVALITPYANRHSVKLIHEIEQEAYLLGEAPKFRQALVNLLKNSIEAMPNGGTVYIGLKILSSGFSIHLLDTGVGMTHEQLARLGEPYFSTKERKGTGLGMMVVYRIVEGLGGEIDVSSEVNKGTHFILTFPELRKEKEEI
ncbi:sensor histidine kinase [Cytobacillus spongiae]|uniref:ATP-binding protein n=1 Tax=Cytobacillus spongiae TaxID=2901381 RepID=UPI001F38D177|nr:sensor histidine kinase [Cytobacillus spongiae]UII56743.1 sensor histidine kinase [Cytobacillus spongiae]